MFDLLYAAAIGDVDAVGYCIKRSSTASFLWGELTRVCGRGRSALHLAVLGNHIPVVELLLQAGADINKRDGEGCTPVFLATRRGHLGLLRRLLRHRGVRGPAARARPAIVCNDGASPMHAAAATGCVESAVALEKAGCPIHTVDCIGCSPLHTACTHGHAAAVRHLLKAGADVNTGSEHVRGESPLHAAVQSESVEIVKMLLAEKALINWRDGAGDTPLHTCCASLSSNRDALRHIAAVLLSDKKIHARPLNEKGHTPLDTVSDRDVRKMLKETLEGRPPVLGDSAQEPAKPSMQDRAAAALAADYAALEARLAGTRRRKNCCTASLCSFPGVGVSGAPYATSPQEHPPPAKGDIRCADEASDATRPGQLRSGCNKHARGSVQSPAAPIAAAGCNSVQVNVMSARGAHSREVQSADVMWFDTGEPFMNQYPARGCMGRYRS